MGERRREVDDRAWLAEVGARHGVQRLFTLQRVDAVLTLVIGNEGDPGRRGVAQDHRRDVRRERIGVLTQLAVLQVERPDVVDVAVARHLGLDRLVGVDRRRGEDDRIRIDELRAAVVVRAERDLRLLARGHVQAEELVVAAHARQVDDRLAVGRPRRCVVAELVVGEVLELLRLEIDGVDVARCAGERREGDHLAVGAEVRRLRHVDGLQLDPLVDPARDGVLQDERLHFLGAGEVRDAVALRRPRHPGHGVVAEPARRRDVFVAAVLVEAAGEVADDLAVLRRHQDDVELLVLPVSRGDRHQIA